MKLPESQLEHLMIMTREYFDNIPSRYRSEPHRNDASKEVIALTKNLAKEIKAHELDELAEEMRSDLRSEESDPNEDRNNDTDYNNERESNFKNAFK